MFSFSLNNKNNKSPVDLTIQHLILMILNIQNSIKKFQCYNYHLKHSITHFFTLYLAYEFYSLMFKCGKIYELTECSNILVAQLLLFLC